MSEVTRSTYIRKIGEGLYEYGFVTRSKNFRKQADRYEPMGAKESVGAAERARAVLEAKDTIQQIEDPANGWGDDRPYVHSLQVAEIVDRWYRRRSYRTQIAA